MWTISNPVSARWTTTTSSIRMSTSAHIRHNSTAHRRKPSVFALSLGDPSLLLDDDENNNSSNSSISPLRFTTSSTSKSKSAAASTSADGSDSISPTLTAAEIKFASQQARKQRKLYAKLLSGCVVVAALLYLGQGFLARRQVDAACARRKDALLGRGEAFAVRLPQQHDGATLDVCSRVMLFKFDGNVRKRVWQHRISSFYAAHLTVLPLLPTGWVRIGDESSHSIVVDRQQTW